MDGVTKEYNFFVTFIHPGNLPILQLAKPFPHQIIAAGSPPKNFQRFSQ